MSRGWNNCSPPLLITSSLTRGGGCYTLGPDGGVGWLQVGVGGTRFHGVAKGKFSTGEGTNTPTFLITHCTWVRTKTTGDRWRQNDLLVFLLGRSAAVHPVAVFAAPTLLIRCLHCIQHPTPVPRTCTAVPCTCGTATSSHKHSFRKSRVTSVMWVRTKICRFLIALVSCQPSVAT